MPIIPFKLSLISPKYPWKQYRQPENGRKIHDSSALFETDSKWNFQFLEVLLMNLTDEQLFQIY